MDVHNGHQTTPVAMFRIGGKLLRQVRFLINLLCFAVAVVVTAWSARAEQLFVVTASMSALRQSAALYLHVADIESGQIHSFPSRLPGRAPLAPLLLSPDGSEALLSTGAAWLGGDFAPEHGRSYVVRARHSPFELQRSGWRFSKDQWREWAAAMLAPVDADEPAIVLLLGLRPSTTGQWESKAEFLHWNAEGFGTPAVAETAWRLPGTPVGAVAAVGPEAGFVLLCEDRDSSQLLLVRQRPNAPLMEGDVVPVPEASSGVSAAPIAIAATADGRHVLVLVSGFDPTAPGEALSWLHVIEADTLRPVGAPVSLLGSASRDLSPLQRDWAGRWWLLTETTGGSFTYLTQVSLDVGLPEPAEKVAEYILSEDSAPLLALNPNGPGLGLAFGPELEIWAAGMPEEPGGRVTFPAPIRVLEWASRGIYVGEAGRLHRLDPQTRTIEFTLPFQSGWVSQVAVIPEPDTTDVVGEDNPGEAANAPQLLCEPVSTLHGQVAGRELRALAIDVLPRDDVKWRIAPHHQTLPWLRVQPLEGRPGEPAYMGIDPALFWGDDRRAGFLTLEITDAHGKRIPGTSAIQTLVQVAPPRNLQPQVLWLWTSGANADMRAPGDPRQLRALADMLAGPPHYFAHTETAGPFNGSLAPYLVVVLNSDAASKGVVTRQAVLDYVARGGSVLFLGGHPAEVGGSSAIAQWFAPAGIEIDVDTAVEGAHAATSRAGLLRHWRNFEMRNGCVYYAADPVASVARTSADGLVFVARGYGYGRIAALSASTPLESDAQQQSANRSFAADLFRWLARAELEFEDMDGDGLPDDAEDKNENGVVEATETSFLLPDSDGDGIMDGMEDANLSGERENEETDPLRRDSDGDGIFDGADALPLDGNHQ